MAPLTSSSITLCKQGQISFYNQVVHQSWKIYFSLTQYISFLQLVPSVHTFICRQVGKAIVCQLIHTPSLSCFSSTHVIVSSTTCCCLKPIHTYGSTCSSLILRGPLPTKLQIHLFQNSLSPKDTLFLPPVEGAHTSVEASRASVSQSVSPMPTKKQLCIFSSQPDFKFFFFF